MPQQVETIPADAALVSAIPAASAAARHSQLSRRLARGATIYTAGLVAGKGLTVVLQIVLGRWLGPAMYGLYALGFSIVALVQWVAGLGLEQGVLRFCTLYRTQNQPGRVRATLRRALAISSVMSLLVAAGVATASGWIALGFFPAPFASVLRLFALTLPFLVVTRIASAYVQSSNDIYRMTMLQNVVGPAANMLLLIVARVLGFRLEGAVGAYVLCNVAATALAIYYLARSVPARGARAGGDHSPLLHYSLALMFVGLSYQLILRVPLLLLGHWRGSAEAGVYGAGSSFALAFGFMPLVFAQPALPMMVELHEGRHFEGLQRLYQDVTRWTLAAVVPFFLFLSLFRSEVMQLFGRDFSAGSVVVPLLSLGWLVYYGKGPASGVLEMTGRQNLELANMGGVALLMLLSNALAIRRYGVGGAAAATATSIIVWALVEYVEIRLLYGLSPWSPAARRNILVALITAAVTAFARRLLPWQLLFVLASSLYAALYLKLCLEPGDRIIASAVFKEIRARLGRSRSASSRSD